MLTALCGNHALRQTLEAMASGTRLPQCFLFYGDAGTGKKTIADWFAARLLCTQSGAPCGVCKNCRTIAEQVHPDVIHVPHSGKLGGFSVETVRNVCAEALIAPNSADKKVYIFSDCDAMDVRSQNILLKLIEEPPAFAVFLFTASAQTCLLPTVRSRLVPLAVSHCTEQETLEHLQTLGYAASQAQEAVRCFHGNIGQCLDYLNAPELQQIAALTNETVHCIIEKNEYALLKTLFAAGTERQTVRKFLLQLDAVIRDALALRLDVSASCIGCAPEQAAILSQTISIARGKRWHEAIGRAFAALSANVNVTLLLSTLGAELMGAAS